MRTHAWRSVRRAGFTLFTVAQLLACEESFAPISHDTDALGFGALSQDPAASASKEAGVLPAPGEVVVEGLDSERGVATLLANEAPRLVALRHLGSAAGVEVVIGQFEDSKRISIRAIERPLESIIAQILEGVPYELRYEASEPGSANELTTVTIGSFRNAQRRLARERRARFLARREEELAQREAGSRTGNEQVARDREVAEAQLLRDLENSDAAIRLAAVRDAPVEGQHGDLLVSLLTSDPSGEVRAAAAERLSESDADGAVVALISALRDPSPEVVSAAIDALEFVGDESIATHLERLAEHPDPGVRAAAQEAAKFLR